MALGAKLAKLIEPPILIELVGDLGSGKTALVKAIAKGLGIVQTVTSPTFNIHRGYKALNGIHLEHFDFYRIEDDDVVINELKESFMSPNTIVCTEWANRINNELTNDKLLVNCSFVNGTEHEYIFIATGPKSSKIIEGLKE